MMINNDNNYFKKKIYKNKQITTPNKKQKK